MQELSEALVEERLVQEVRKPEKWSGRHKESQVLRKLPMGPAVDEEDRTSLYSSC